ncbi:MAG: PEP-CTERM sorting domain-containing protein [Planctomycetota bacterium]
MRTRIPTRSAAGLTGLTLFAAVATPPTSAELLLYEGFDYAVSSNLVGQNGGDWDPTRAWTTGGPSNGSINAATVVNGLTFSDYAVTGNAAQVVNNHNGSGPYQSFNAGRQLPSGFSTPAGSDIWVSFLFNQDENGSFANETGLTFADSVDNVQRKLQSRTVTLFGDNNPDNAAVGADNGVGTSSGAVIAQDTTYLAVSKFTNVNGPTFSSNTGTMWVLEASDWDAIKTGPLDEAALDANNLLKVDHAPGNTFVVDLTSDDFLRLDTVTGFGINNRAEFDEIRVGTTLDSVVVIPEPSSILLAALGGLAMLGRRRHR